jgi:hypothetical protein
LPILFGREEVFFLLMVITTCLPCTYRRLEVGDITFSAKAILSTLGYEE